MGQEEGLCKRGRKGVDPFDLGFLCHHIVSFQVFCFLYSLEEIFKLRIFPYTIIILSFID